MIFILSQIQILRKLLFQVVWRLKVFLLVLLSFVLLITSILSTIKNSRLFYISRSLRSSNSVSVLKFFLRCASNYPNLYVLWYLFLFQKFRQSLFFFRLNRCFFFLNRFSSDLSFLFQS